MTVGVMPTIDDIDVGLVHMCVSANNHVCVGSSKNMVFSLEN